jgi:hypothetical protein
VPHLGSSTRPKMRHVENRIGRILLAWTLVSTLSRAAPLFGCYSFRIGMNGVLLKVGRPGRPKRLCRGAQRCVRRIHRHRPPSRYAPPSRACKQEVTVSARNRSGHVFALPLRREIRWVSGAQVHPVLAGVVAEREQVVLVIGDLRGGLPELAAKRVAGTPSPLWMLPGVPVSGIVPRPAHGAHCGSASLTGLLPAVQYGPRSV